MSRRVHIVGIGGAGMSGIAKVLKERGEIVSGSDREPSAYATALERMHIPVSYAHRAENVSAADLVLVSRAVPEDNVEVLAARQAGIPILHRDDFWGELTAGYETVAVAGTHGKTTTSGLIAWILVKLGLSPSFIVGGELLDLGTNAAAGKGRQFVLEADEYGLAFLGMRPDLAVVTNVEHDHPDQFLSLDAVKQAFQTFADQVQRRLIVCADDPGAMDLEFAGRRRVTYGLSGDALWRAEEVRPNQAGGSDFLVIQEGRTLGLARIRLPGAHNVSNALAALAALDELEVDFGAAREALTGFHGASRRFEVMGEAAGVLVVDDYAHHPTEIRATLRAARSRYPQATLHAVFQPHTFSRTKAMLGELASSFELADEVIVTEIYAAREAPDPAVSGEIVAQAVQHDRVKFVPDLESVAQVLGRRVKPGSVVLILSAGDANRVGERLLEDLRSVTQGSGDEHETAQSI